MAGCGTSLPTANALRAQFASHKIEFVQLRDMILQDSTSRSHFLIGAKEIGDYWETGSLGSKLTRWKMSNPNINGFDPLGRSLDEVLAREGISADRYKTYTTLLHGIGAIRVEVFTEPKSSKQTVTFLVYRDGFAGNGCGASIDWESDDIVRTAVPGMESTISHVEPQWFTLSRCS
jgi:hypothetical protein